MSKEAKQVALSELDAIIFDLGGVILHLDYRATISALSELLGRDIAPLYTQAQQSTLFDRFERGEVNRTDFYRELLERLPSAQSLSPRLSETKFFSALELGWNAMLLRIPDGNLQLLRALKTKLPIYLLSNTNESHLEHFLADYQRAHEPTQGPFADHFERAYYSHLMGQRKPETRIFETVIQENGLRPERTLFIDDNRANLAGASATGLKTLHHETNADLTAVFDLNLDTRGQE